MSGEEKLNSCIHKPAEQIEIFEGCPCQNRKKQVYRCVKRSIIDVKAEICQDCELFENKTP